jgi:2',3'-cyclic-nucleotide 2'-phosphodiesterase
VKVLLIGDVVGRPGRRALRELLPGLRLEFGLDFVVANGENSAGGTGITRRTLEDILQSGVDVVTTGNHVYRHAEALALLESRSDRLLRPLNHSAGAPGTGVVVREDREGRRVGVINLQGRIFMPPGEDPFAAAEKAVSELAGRADVVLVDLHGEATSEKQAMGWFLDGKVAVMVGTHTHVPTADARVLPQGTAYVTDLGMTGPHDSCLGVKKEIIVRKFCTGLPQRFDVAKGDIRLQGVVAEIDAATGLARSIERVERTLS